jgi:hypothetical protein
MKAFKFVHLIWELNALIDSGKYLYVSVEDVKKGIRTGDIPEYLKQTFPTGDFSLIEAVEWPQLTKDWQYNVGDLDERRKMGVTNSGLCLLLGYALNGLQQHPDYQKIR